VCVCGCGSRGAVGCPLLPRCVCVYISLISMSIRRCLPISNLCLLIAISSLKSSSQTEGKNKIIPTVVATWKFGEIAVTEAIDHLLLGVDSVSVVEKAINKVELDNNDQYYVGVGGFPNSEGYMELDAAIMDHDMNYGAVMGLPNISTPISVAKAVMEKSVHNILVGDGALTWALSQNFKESTDVLTSDMLDEWVKWKGVEREKFGLTNTKVEVNDQHDTVGSQQLY